MNYLVLAPVLAIQLLWTPAQAQWVTLAPTTVPPARTVACFSQIKGGGVLMFGGSGQGSLSDTWLFQDGDWHDMSSLGGGKSPPGRSLGAMAAYENGAVLFGGYTSTVHSANDTWVWDPSNGWKELTQSLADAPAGRSYHTMQATDSGVLLFGGTARTDEAHDTAIGDSWLFSAAKWAPVFASTALGHRGASRRASPRRDQRQAGL